MSAAATNTPHLSPPIGSKGEGCSPLELVTIVGIMSQPNKQGSLPKRIAELFADRRKEFADLGQFVGALHPHTVTQLEGMLQGVGVGADQLEDALRFAAEPIEAGKEEAKAMGWKRGSLQRRRSSLESLGQPAVTFNVAQRYRLAQIFWQGRPSLEAASVAKLDEADRKAYHLHVWKAEGIFGLQRRSTAENFAAEEAWMAVVGACGTNLQRVKGVVQLAHHNDNALAKAAAPAIQRYFRVHARQLVPTTMFDPSIGAAKAARSRYGDAAADQNALPDIDWEDPDAIAALPVADLSRLLRPLRSWQLATLHGRSETLDASLAEALEEVNFPDFSEWLPPGIPVGWVEHVIPYLDPADLRSLMYSCRRFNAYLGNPNLPMWETVAKRSFPEANDLALQTPDEWHAIFKMYCQLGFVDQAIRECGQDEMAAILTARGQEDLPMVYQLWGVQRWDGITPVDEVDSALQSLMMHELWAQLVTIGAELTDDARHAWWFTVGQRLRPLQVNDVVIRCDPQDYPALKEGTESRNDDDRDKVVQIAATCFAAGQGLNRGGGDTSALQRQIGKLRRAVDHIQPVVDQLDKEHDLIRADLQLKADQKRAMELFATHPNLQMCYKAAQVKLEEVFISAKAASGGHVKVAEGALTKGATVVEFLGEFIDFIPASGALVKLATEGLKQLDELRQTNLARNLSSQITTADMLKQVEEMARWLTLTFEPQLRGLATQVEAKESRGKASRATHKVKKRVTYERRLSPAERFAEFGVFCLFNRLRAAARGKLQLPDQPHSEIFVDVISSMRPRKQKTKGSDKGQRNTDRALQKVKNAQVRLASGGKASLRELFTRPGIKAADGSVFEADWTQAPNYGHLNGTSEMAERRGIPCIQEGGGASAAAASTTSSPGTATQLQRQVQHERRQRKALATQLAELEARLPPPDADA
jgi:hypothetical protein